MEGNFDPESIPVVTYRSLGADPNLTGVNQYAEKLGAPGKTRTPNLLIRSHVARHEHTLSHLLNTLILKDTRTHRLRLALVTFRPILVTYW